MNNYEINDLINNVLLSNEYYFSKLPMLLKESYGIKEQVELDVLLLQKINEISKKFLSLLYVFIHESVDTIMTYDEFKLTDEDYQKVENPVKNDLYKYYEKSNNKYVITSDTSIVSQKNYYILIEPLFLKMLCDIVGINRRIKLNPIYQITTDTYRIPGKLYYKFNNGKYEIYSTGNIDNTTYEKIEKYITLTNNELILVAKLKYYSKNYNGTNESIRYIYDNIGINHLNVYYISTDNLAVTIYLQEETEFSEFKDDYPNLTDIFQNTDYFISSLGISYNKSIVYGSINIFKFREDDDVEPYKDILDDNNAILG